MDIDAILARVDLPALTEQVIDEVDLGEIIRESSSTMASETVDALRVQGMRVDGLVSRIVDRVLLREGQRQTGPSSMSSAAMTRDIRYAEARALQGHRAGFASRVVADLVDLGVVWLLGLSVLVAAGVVRYLLTGPPFRLPVLPNWLDATAGAAIAVAYLTFTWAATGRSVGKQLAGLRVVGRVAAGCRCGARSPGPCCMCCSRLGCCGSWPAGTTPRCRT